MRLFQTKVFSQFAMDLARLALTAPGQNLAFTVQFAIVMNDRFWAEPRHIPDGCGLALSADPRQAGPATTLTPMRRQKMSGPPFTVRDLGEVAIRCRDLAAMTAFYSDVVGLEVIAHYGARPETPLAPLVAGRMGRRPE